MSLALLVCLGVLACVSPAAAQRLQFRADGTFRVVQFTDMHFGGSEDQTQSAQNAVLTAEVPDLTIVTGDVVDLSGTQKMKDHWDTAVENFQKSGIPYAITLGNHDTQVKGTTRLIETSWDMTHKGSLTAMMYNSTLEESYANYYLQVFDGEQVRALLWMLDSCGSGSNHQGCQGHSGWPCVPEDVVAWFVNQSAVLNAGRSEPIPAFLFTHVPTVEFDDVWKKSPCLGAREEDVCFPSYNTGLYAAARKVGGVRGIFAGHDHKNDYCGALPEEPGLQLCYGRKTGFANYNSDNLRHGGRVIELAIDRKSDAALSWKSWIRNDLGEIDPQEWHYPSKN